jgi:lipoyl-dependent peroxiredoxin
MPRIERRAAIHWEGNLARGSGLLSAGTGAFSKLPFSNATRVGQPDGRTSPEELLAAAHGACFTTSLVNELTKLGHPPASVELGCRIVMDEVAGQGHQVIESHVTLHASVPGIDRETFDGAVAAADDGCPYSSLLKRAGVRVEVAAELVTGG